MYEYQKVIPLERLHFCLHCQVSASNYSLFQSDHILKAVTDVPTFFMANVSHMDYLFSIQGARIHNKQSNTHISPHGVHAFDKKKH